MNQHARFILFFLLIAACGKKGSSPPPPNPVIPNFSLTSWAINNLESPDNVYNVSRNPIVKFRFSASIKRATVSANIIFKEITGTPVSCNITYEHSDSVVVLQPLTPLNYLFKYKLAIVNLLKSSAGGSIINSGNEISFVTSIDSSRKFPLISDDSLLTLVQKQSFGYFWNFAHPVSGLARERNSDLTTVTTGGSGFGIMSIPVAVNRGFISRAAALARMQTIVAFLKNTADKFHGAFPHWLNGTTGKVIPFSTKDNGADLVETAYLMQGLLCARQYFNDVTVAETALRDDINILWNGVEWNWFRQNNQNVLYWHWSPNYNWDMNFPIRGWNEALITYVLAASSTTYSIPSSVYTGGWAANTGNGFINGTTYYSLQLPLGPSYGGPLFFSHYSFLGINPNGLADAYANYQIQTKNHTLINYNYCKSNSKNYFGYSDSCWGLTASDIQGGYTASSPTNDQSFIAPTAALSSFPYTPTESMKALKFFYYVLGDKIWKDYGFTDAFSLNNLWYADSYLAIDQGPIIIMIENYRSNLLWNLFTSCPEVKNGMRSLGFTAPYL